MTAVAHRFGGPPLEVEANEDEEREEGGTGSPCRRGDRSA
jgi:hypothetical protein